MLQGLASLNLIIFVTTALLIAPHWESINVFLGSATGFAANYVLGIVLISLAPLSFSSAIFLLCLREMLQEGLFTPRRRSHVLSILFAFLFDSLLLLLVVIWGNDGIIVFNALEFQIPFILLTLNIGFFVCLYSTLPSLLRVIGTYRSSKESVVKILMVIIVSIGVLSTPFIVIPSHVYSTALPHKPLLIAHRGGSCLGPENTIEAATVALDHGIAGLEIDVQISQDGIPFLMHDDTLERTTNINEIFPTRSSDEAETFALSELMELNAGEWFVLNDPYCSIRNGFVTPVQANSFLNAHIPTLENITAFAAEHDIILDVDFKDPSPLHPYFSEYFDICLAILADAGIDENIWITARNSTWLDIVHLTHPDMVTALTLDDPTLEDIQSFKDLEYDMLNTRMGLTNDIFHGLESQSIQVNAWTVNAEFRFSQLWCLGVDYVTTDTPHLYNVMDIPLWSLPGDAYRILWICWVGFVVLFVLFKHSRLARG